MIAGEMMLTMGACNGTLASHVIHTQAGASELAVLATAAGLFFYFLFFLIMAGRDKDIYTLQGPEAVTDL